MLPYGKKLSNSRGHFTNFTLKPLAREIIYDQWNNWNLFSCRMCAACSKLPSNRSSRFEPGFYPVCRWAFSSHTSSYQIIRDGLSSVTEHYPCARLTLFSSPSVIFLNHKIPSYCIQSNLNDGFSFKFWLPHFNRDPDIAVIRGV